MDNRTKVVARMNLLRWFAMLHLTRRVTIIVFDFKDDECIDDSYTSCKNINQIFATNRTLFL